MDELKLWMDFTQSVGVPAALLMFFMWMFFRYIAVPVTQSHIALVGSLQVTTEQNALTAKANAETLKRQTELGEGMLSVINKTSRSAELQVQQTENLANAIGELACHSGPPGPAGPRGERGESGASSHGA